MSQVFKAICAAGFVAAFSCISPSAEASVAFTVDKRAGNLFQDTGRSIISVNGDHRNYYSGGFDLTTSDGPLGDFIAFCLDIHSAFSTPSQYKITPEPFSETSGTLSDRAIQTIQGLYDSSYDSLTTNIDWGGFQFALWEAVNEDNPVFEARSGQTMSGTFFQDRNTAEARDTAARANQFLAAAAAYDGAQKYRLIFLESQDVAPQDGKRDSQNLVAVSAVPLPLSGLLLVTALAGGAAAWRRRKTA